MIKSKATIIMGVVALLYLIQVYFKFNGIAVFPWYDGYFADLICLPLMLYFAVLIIRKIKKNPQFLLNKKMIAFSWIYLSITFELMLPKFSNRYTADALDVIIYGLGGMLYYLFQRKYMENDSHVNGQL